MNIFYGHKINSTHVFDKEGKRLLVTKIAVRPLVITQLKSKDKDGYQAVQLGIGHRKRLTKPVAGKLKNSDFSPANFREMIIDDTFDKKVGEVIEINDIFKLGDKVSVHSVSKGKGFAGAMKRWGFAGGPATHGQSDRPRSPGSIGQGTTPGRVWKGKKMAGHMGSKMSCVRGGRIVKIQNDQIWITGTVPGAKDTMVTIKKIGSSEFLGLYQEEENK